MWTKLKYYLGFTCIINTSLGWFITKRALGMRVYKDRQDDEWWSLPTFVLTFCNFSSKEEALKSLYRKNELTPKWQDI